MKELQKKYVIANVSYGRYDNNYRVKLYVEDNTPTKYDTLEEAENELFTNEEYQYGTYSIIPVYENRSY